MKHGNPRFYQLLEEMAETHDKKSHDYASNENPFGNYHFAGQIAAMFSHSPDDAGFAGRIAEKVYRLANLEGEGKQPKNESIEDTERDIAVITCLWIADRRDRRGKVVGVREVSQETAAPEKEDKVMSVLVSLEPLMDKYTLNQAISYLRESEEYRLRRVR